MPALQSILPPNPVFYEPQRDDPKIFTVRPPEGVAIDVIEASISDPDGSRVAFSSASSDRIVLDLSYVYAGRSFTVEGYQGGVRVATYTRVAMDLDILDVKNLLLHEG